MLKKVLFVNAVAFALLLSGCAKSYQADPKEADSAVAETTQAVQEESTDKQVDKVAEDAVEAKDSATESAKSIVKLPVIYFDFDRFDIRSDMQDAINDIARTVKMSAGVKYRIEGNCDEWGTDEYNYALGLSRAKSVQDALMRAGVSKEQLSLISYGESNPVCKDSNRECWKQNRRVELTILP